MINIKNRPDNNKTPMKKGEHPEVDRYVAQLKDKSLYDLPSVEDARAYYRMRLAQTRKPLPAVETAPAPKMTKKTREELVTEAYLQTYCHRKRVQPKEPVQLDATTRALVYRLFVAGVLPVRLGGVNL